MDDDTSNIESFKTWCKRVCKGHECLARQLHDRGILEMKGLDGHLNWGALRERCGRRRGLGINPDKGNG